MVKLVKQNYLENIQLYNRVVTKLRKRLDSNVPIDHVGSTAIPNMYGKNIIDILIGAKDNTEFEKIKKILTHEGYFPNKNTESAYQFFASSNKETGSGDAHLHLVISDTERYKEYLILKNYLLNNAEEVLAYSNHKKEIIAKGFTVRKEYKAIKSEYVTQLIERAKKKFINKWKLPYHFFPLKYFCIFIDL